MSIAVIAKAIAIPIKAIPDTLFLLSKLLKDKSLKPKKKLINESITRVRAIVFKTIIPFK